MIIGLTVAAMKIGWLRVLGFFFLLCTMTVGAVEAVSRTFMVSAGKEVVVTIDLSEGVVVSGRVNVVGGSDNTIKFYIAAPDEDVIVRFDRASATDFGFTASETGTYSLHFDNASSDSDKTVTLNYDTRYYIFGIPQEYFYALVVLFIGLVGVMVFVALART